MSVNKKIDEIFKQASQDFSLPAPKGAWDRLASSLLRRKRLKRLLFALIGLGIAALLLWLQTCNTHQPHRPLKQNHHPASITKQESSITPSTSPEQEKSTLTPPAATLGANTAAETTGIVAAQKQGSRTAKALQSSSQSPPREDASPVLKPQPGIAEAQAAPDGSPKEYSTPALPDNKPFDTLKAPAEPARAPAVQPKPKTNIPENDSILSSGNDEQPKPTPTLVRGIILGIGIGFNTPGQSSYHAGKNTISLMTDDYNSPTLTYNIRYYLTYGSWYFETGLRPVNITRIGSFTFPGGKVHYVQTADFGTTLAGYYDVEDLDNSLQKRHWGTVDYLRELTYSRLQISMIDLPLSAGYRWQHKQWQFQIFGGGGLSFINKAELISGDRYGDLLYGHISRLKPRVWELSSGAEGAYRLDTHLSIGVRSELLYYFDNLSASPDFIYRPLYYSFGLQAGYRF